MKSPLLRPPVLITCGIAAFLGGTWWPHPPSVPGGPPGAEVPSAFKNAGNGAAHGPTEASVKKLFQETKAVPDLTQLLTLLRGGSKLTAEGQISTEVAKLDKKQVASWLKQIDLLPFGDSVQESLRRSLIERWGEVDMAGLMLEAGKPGNFGGKANQWIVMDTAFRALAAKNPEEAWEKAKRMGQSGYAAKQAILSELALTNPAAGLKLIAARKMGNDSWAMQSFFQTWAGQDPAAAAASLDQMKNTRDRRNALGAVASAWGQRDPAGALAWADGQASAGDRSSTLSAILTTQADSDPQGALSNQAARNLGRSQSGVMSGILNVWANRDFDAALSYATSQTKFSDKAASLSGVVQAINNDEGRASQLLNLAETLPFSMARNIYQSGIYALMNNQPEKVQDWIDRIKQPSIKETTIRNAMQSGWDVSGDVKAKLFDQLQATSQKPDEASEIASSWANEDPDKAMAWAEKIGNLETRKKAIEGVISAMAQQDPQAAAKQVTTMPAGETREAAIAALANAWVEQDAKGAQAWAAGLKGDEQSKVLKALVGSAQQEDPASAPQAYATYAASLSAEAAAKKENQTVASDLAKVMAQDDPQTAIKWMETLPGGGARDQAIGGIAETWINYDPGAASEWITKLPAGEGRDTAAGKLAATVARDDPSAAFVWANSIADPAARRKSAEAVLETWKNNGGKEAAGAALQGANFNEQDRAELLKKFE